MADDGAFVQLVVAEGGDRLDRYLASHLDLSRSRLEQLIDANEVLVNGLRQKKRYLTAPGDVIALRVPAPLQAASEPEEIPLDIIYQDPDIVVVNKAAGMVVHPAPGNRTGTLVNALLHHVGDLSGIGGVLRPGILHRLDRDTSGLLIVAKNDLAHERLSDAMKRREIKRTYLAAAWGHLAEDALTVDAPVGRHPTERKHMAVVSSGRRAVTHFRRLEKWRAADLVSAELETGRTHQIRVHLRHIGHPVVGDSLYGAGRERGTSGVDRPWAASLARRTRRQFLHAAEIRFAHPRTGDPLEFRVDLPPDLAEVAAWARIPA